MQAEATADLGSGSRQGIFPGFAPCTTELPVHGKYLVMAGEPEETFAAVSELSEAMDIAAFTAARSGPVRIFSLTAHQFLAAYVRNSKGGVALL